MMRCCDVQLKSINRSEPLSIRVQAAKPRATKPIKNSWHDRAVGTAESQQLT